MFFDNECTKNVHQIPIYIPKNVQTVQNLHKVHTENDLNLEIYVFCTYKYCKLYKTYTTS